MRCALTLPRITQNALLVYQRISGMITAVNPVIHASVYSLEDEFHTVRLCDGSEDDGIMNGNIAVPTAPMTPIQASAPSHHARCEAPLRAATRPPSRPAYAEAGTSHRIAWARKLTSQSPVERSTICRSGVWAVAGSGPRTR